MKTKLSFLLLIIAIVLSACAPKAPAPVAPAGEAAVTFTETIRLAYNEASAVWAAHIPLETQQSVLAAQYTNLMQNLKDRNADEFYIVNSCYENAESFLTTALTGAFGDDGLDTNTDSPYLNVLVLKETFPSGVSVDECQRAATSMIIASRADREQALNIKNEILRVRQAITELEMGSLKRAIVIDFYEKYGEDLVTLVENGDAAFADFVGSKSADQVLPIGGLVGFPTEALSVTTRNLDLAYGYADIFEERVAPPYGKYAYEYMVSIDSVSGVATLYKEAAYSYITLLITPARNVSDNLESGCTSVLAGCDEE